MALLRLSDAFVMQIIFAHRCWEDKERDDLAPLGLDVIIGLTIPLAAFLRPPAIFPAAEVQGMTHQLHSAGPNRSVDGKPR